ncbi:hypothetical protein Tco_0697083, partial [Tanacetum coccineum]
SGWVPGSFHTTAVVTHIVAQLSLRDHLLVMLSLVRSSTVPEWVMLGLKDFKIFLELLLLSRGEHVFCAVFAVFVVLRFAVRFLLTPTAQLQLLSDYYCWKEYADRDEIKD